MLLKSQLGMCMVPVVGMPIQVTDNCPRALSSGVEMIVRRQEVFVRQGEKLVDFLGAIAQIETQLCRTPPVHHTVQAAVEVGVTDEEAAAHFSSAKRVSSSILRK